MVLLISIAAIALSAIALVGVAFCVDRIGELRIHTHLVSNPEVDRRRASRG